MIRKLFQYFGNKYLSRKEVIQIAQEYCKTKEWIWMEPILIQEGPIHTIITTNSGIKGGNARIKIDARNGKVISAGFAYR